MLRCARAGFVIPAPAGMTELSPLSSVLTLPGATMPTPQRPGSFLLPAISVLAASLGCASLPGCSAKKVSDRDVAFVDPADAHELSRGSGGVLGIGRSTAGWVDPRPASKHQAGHIPGAISVPIDTVIERDSRLAGFDTIIVYGDDYGDPVAVAMAKKLLALGYQDVRTLRGGLRAWKQAGNEVETQDTTTTPAPPETEAGG